MHQLPNLPYKYSDLEPHLDEETMRIHHLKHHQAYIDKLNIALEKYPDLAQLKIEELMSKLETVPEDIRLAVRNHGGGHLNHSLFWTMLTGEKTEPREQTITMLDEHFGGLEDFQAKFIASALNHFGSGWVWLAVKDGKFEIISTGNQDTPVSQGAKIILGVDVWEHAYYLKYQNRRAEYLEAFFKVINWDEIERNIVA